MRRYMIFMTVEIIICMILVGCNRVTEKKEQQVVGIVTHREFEEEYYSTKYVHVHRTLVPISHHHPAKYLITITYEGIEQTFDNSTLYNKVDVGDSVEVTLVNGYNKNHELVTQYLKY